MRRTLCQDRCVGIHSGRFGDIQPAAIIEGEGATPASTLRPLAVSSDKRIANLPDVPAVSEVLPGFFVTSWWAIVAPPGMPPELTNKISAAVGEVMRQPDVTKRLTEMSIVSTGSSPAELSSREALPAPGLLSRPDLVSGTRAPWLNANGWRFLRKPAGKLGTVQVLCNTNDLAPWKRAKRRAWRLS
jgi:hypothetical protein